MGKLRFFATTHQALHHLFGLYALFYDLPGGLHNGHFHFVLLFQRHDRRQSIDALHHHAGLPDSFLHGNTLTDQGAAAVIPAMDAGGRYDQVADAGKSTEGLGFAAHCDSQARDFCHTPGNQGGLGIITVAQAGGNTGCKGNDILHCAAQLHTQYILIGVHPHTGAPEHILHQLRGFLILTSGHNGGG